MLNCRTVALLVAGAFASLAVSGCHLLPAQVAADVEAGEAVVCPLLSPIAFGSEVCAAVATLVEGFIRNWGAASVANAEVLFRARAALGSGLTRVGPYGFFPESLAAELRRPGTRAALDAWVRAGGAR